MTISTPYLLNLQFTFSLNHEQINKRNKKITSSQYFLMLISFYILAKPLCSYLSCISNQASWLRLVPLFLPKTVFVVNIQTMVNRLYLKCYSPAQSIRYRLAAQNVKTSPVPPITSPTTFPSSLSSSLQQQPRTAFGHKSPPVKSSYASNPWMFGGAQLEQVGT